MAIKKNGAYDKRATPGRMAQGKTEKPKATEKAMKKALGMKK